MRAALLVALGGALYANALGNSLVWDDRLTAAASAAVTGATGSYYRPVVMLSFALDRWLWGGAPLGFHATNLACHLGVAWLVGALAEAVGLGAGAALAAALVFAAHPVQTEAVTYVSGRTDVLAALFVVLALLAWRRARRAGDGFAVASAAATAAALLAKEAAVAMPLALLVRGAHSGRHPPRPILPLAVAGVWLVAYGVAGPATVDAGGLGGRVAAVALAALGYLRLLLWPVGLHLERFTPVGGWSAAVGVGAWLLLGTIAVAAWWIARRTPAGAFLLALAALAYAPVSNLVPVYPAIADRALFTPEHFMYLPLVGLVPLVVGAVARVVPPAAGVAALAVALTAWGALVVDRNRDWRDEETLFRHTVAYRPPAARVWYNLANLSLAAGRNAEAEQLYREAIAREPGDGAAHLNLGITLQRRGDRAGAEAEYRRAMEADPTLAEAYRALAALLAARGATAEAARVLSGLPGGRP